MAKRRMFSMDIIDTDAFMDMPHSTQCLYMHLAMRADDDGFVASAKKIMRMIGSQDDDLKILLTKRFIIPFEDKGVCVIKHWKIHNYIQKDRYTPTKYEEEMALLKVKSNGGYTLDTECIQNGDTGKVRLGKSKERIDKKESVGEFGLVKLLPEEKQKLKDRYGLSATKKLVEELDSYLKSSGKRYKSHYATLLSWARRKGVEEIKHYVQPTEEELTPEQIERNKVKLAEIRANFNFKK